MKEIMENNHETNLSEKKNWVKPEVVFVSKDKIEGGLNPYVLEDVVYHSS